MKNFKYNERVQLTKNINVLELRCKGKNHTHDTLVNVEFIHEVQNFMNYLGATKIIISRGYSCSEYNKQIGGSKTSKHVTEGAIDCVFYKNDKIIPAKEVCVMAQDYGFKGIAYIDRNYVHLDNRIKGLYRGDERRGYHNNVGNDFYKYFGISKVTNLDLPTLPKRGYFINGDKGEEVKKLQRCLNATIKSNLNVDGIIGKKTIQSIKTFQKKENIKADGLFGRNSLEKLQKYVK